MAAGARAGDIRREHAAPGILRWKDSMCVVAVGARGRVSAAPLQKELTMSTGSKLCKLVGMQPELPHFIGIRMT